MAYIPPKNRQELIAKTKELADAGDTAAMAKMAELTVYKKALWREKRMEAVDWYRKATAANPKYAAKFYDALRDFATIECIHESIDVALRYFKTDNEVKFRLAKALIDGYVLERNINNAFLLLHELSVDTKKYEFAYIDTAMSMGIADFYPTAFEDCKKMCENRINGAKGRLAKMYSKGIGTEKDVNTALKMYSENLKYDWKDFIDCILENEISDRYAEAADALVYGGKTIPAIIRSAELRKRINGLDETCIADMRSAAAKKKPWSVKYMDDMMAMEEDLQGKYDICSALCDYSSLDVAKKVFLRFPKLETGIEPVHKAELGLLKDFLDVCDKAGVKAIADGGTLLGCVRHKGFIPWDDDFDFRMFISDINKLEEYMMKDRRDCYFVMPSLDRRKYRFFSYSYVAWVDVFPIQSQLVYYDHTIAVDHPVTMADKDKYPGLMGVIYRSLRDCSVLVTGPHFNEEQLFPLRKLPFEDVELWAPNDYDHTLKTFYGNYMFMPDEWHIHLDKKTVKEIGDMYEHRNEVAPEVKTIGHLTIAYKYAGRGQNDFAKAWTFKALQEVLSEEECKEYENADLDTLRRKTLITITANMSEKISYEQVIFLLCKFHDMELGPDHPWEYFLLLEKAYILNNKMDIYFFLRKRIAGGQIDLLKKCADKLLENDLLPGHYAYAVMYIKALGMDADNEKAQYHIDKVKTASAGEIKAFKTANSKAKLPNSDRFLKLLEIDSEVKPVDNKDAEPKPRKPTRDELVSMGRAYRNAKGVDKDLFMAADCMRKAKFKGNTWIYKELCDVLWETKTPEAYKERVEILIPEVNKGKHEAIGRLGLAYRDGKGLNKDPAEARRLFKLAAESDAKWKKYIVEE